MGSREKILQAVKNGGGLPGPVPEIPDFRPPFDGVVEKFAGVLQDIGGAFFRVNTAEEIGTVLKRQFPETGRIVSPWSEIRSLAEPIAPGTDPHLLENVYIAVLEAEFAVAENGAAWIMETGMGTRVLPFICQHLVVVVPENKLVATMHDAYARIGSRDYGFGVFIAGPSKTADIEQSLVLGAHGARSMTILLLAK